MHPVYCVQPSGLSNISHARWTIEREMNAATLEVSLDLFTEEQNLFDWNTRAVSSYSFGKRNWIRVEAKGILDWTFSLKKGFLNLASDCWSPVQKDHRSLHFHHIHCAIYEVDKIMDTQNDKGYVWVELNHSCESNSIGY